MHGVALNVDPDLSHFSGIVPCGVADERYGVTSLVDLGHLVTLPEVDVKRENALGEREIVTAIVVPPPSPTLRSAYGVRYASSRSGSFGGPFSVGDER